MDCCIENSILSIWGEFGCDKNLLKQKLNNYTDDTALLNDISDRTKILAMFDIDTFAGGVRVQ